MNSQPQLIQEISSEGFSFRRFFTTDEVSNETYNLIVEKTDDGKISLQYALELSACESLLVAPLSKHLEESITVFEFEIQQQSSTAFIFSRLNELLEKKSSIRRIYCSDSQMILFQIAQSKLEGEWFNLWLIGKAAELTACIHTCVTQEQITIGNSWLKEDERKKIQQAKDILINQLHQPVPIKTLAKRVGINENYLKRGFKEIFGATIYQYYQEERMKYAVQQLKSNQTSVKEVAYNLGYNSVSHFSTAFKKVKGLLPCELIK